MPMNPLIGERRSLTFGSTSDRGGVPPLPLFPCVLTPAHPFFKMVIARAGSDYYQPYWMPFGLYYPFPGELVAPLVGCAPATPSLPKDEPASSAKLWTACERAIEVAGAARSDAPSAARG